jgi:hypothetical protein
MRRRAVSRTVRLVPTGTAYIPGVPAVECEVDEERAAELLSYNPPAFVLAEEPDEATTEESDASADH